MATAPSGLVGDVGGTHARFAVGPHRRRPRPASSQARVLRRGRLSAPARRRWRPTSPSLDGARPRLAVIAAAGPDRPTARVELHQQPRLAVLRARGWQRPAAFARVRLINDFTAQALAIPHLQPDDTRLIGPRAARAGRARPRPSWGRAPASAPARSIDDGRAPRGPDRRRRPCRLRARGRDRGGDPAPADDALRPRLGRARLLSGPGPAQPLPDRWRDIAGRAGAARPRPTQVTPRRPGGRPPGARGARRGSAPSSARSPATSRWPMGARGGVYISGGIAPDILDFLKASDFRRRFEAKDRMSDYLRAIPTRVVIQPHAALIGAASLLDEPGRPAMIRARRARIVATLGPASRAPDEVLALARAGVDVFRLNFSHGAHDDHAAGARRRCARPKRRSTGRWRCWPTCRGRSSAWATSRAAGSQIAPGQRLRLDLDPAPGDARRVSLPHPELFAALCAGADAAGRRRQGAAAGRALRRRLRRRPRWWPASALSDHKGVALPGVRHPAAGADAQGPRRPGVRPAHRRRLGGAVVRAARRRHGRAAPARARPRRGPGQDREAGGARTTWTRSSTCATG